MLFNWSEVKLDVRAHYTDIRAGAAYQEFLPPSAEADGLLDDFDHSPGISRGILGVENRTAREASVKLDWELGGATLTSISAYSKLDQDLYGSIVADTSGFRLLRSRRWRRRATRLFSSAGR